MTIGILKSPKPRNRNNISEINSKFLSVSSTITLLAILKVTDAIRDIILAGRLNHRFPWRHLSPEYHVKVLPKKFHLIGKTTGFRPKVISCEKSTPHNLEYEKRIRMLYGNRYLNRRAIIYNYASIYP